MVLTLSMLIRRMRLRVSVLLFRGCMLGRRTGLVFVATMRAWRRIWRRRWWSGERGSVPRRVPLFHVVLEHLPQFPVEVIREGTSLICCPAGTVSAPHVSAIATVLLALLVPAFEAEVVQVMSAHHLMTLAATGLHGAGCLALPAFVVGHPEPTTEVSV